MVRVLRVARSRPEVLEYVTKVPRCPDCQAHAGPEHRGRAVPPRTFQFNKVVGIDCFKVPWKGQQHNFLSMVCHGTKLNMITYLSINYTAEDVWRGFSCAWLTHFGAPEVLICDDGSELKPIFERRLERLASRAHRNGGRTRLGAP